jgi:hypothetical protein
MRAHRAECVRNARFSIIAARREKASTSIGGAARVTNPTKKLKKTSALQRAKMQSSARIFAPRIVIEVEIWNGLTWRPAVSSGGVVIEVSTLRARALVEARRG